MKYIIITLSLFINQLTIAQDRLLNHPPMVQKMEVSITADELMAKTVVTITVVNNTKLQMENFWCFNVAPNTRITDFKLDLYGTFRDASIDETWKVQNAYNTVVGKRMDPAIIRKTNENSYCINVYPVEPGQTRRLQFTMLQLLENREKDMYYNFPLHFANMDSLITNIKVDAPYEPRFEKGLFGELRFTNNNNFSFKNIQTKVNKANEINFSIPKQTNQNFITKTNKDNHFLTRLTPTNTNAYPTNGKHVNLFFDISINNTERNYVQEIKALDDFFKFHKTMDVKLSFFNDELRETIYFNPKLDSSWKTKITNHKNYNGMRLSCLPLSNIQEGIILICSNGQNSWGASKTETALVPVFLINTAYGINSHQYNNYYNSYKPYPTVNKNLLQVIEQTGGQVLYLSNINYYNTKWLETTLYLKRYILNIETNKGKKLHCNITLPAEDKLVNAIYGLKDSEEDSIVITYNQVAQNLKTVEKIAIKNAPSKMEIERANIFFTNFKRTQYYTQNEELLWGINERVVTYVTSFIVLEKIEDYIRFNIAPPAALEAACAAKGYVYMSPKVQYYNAIKRIEKNNGEKINKLLERKNQLLNIQKPKPKEAIPTYDNTYAINENKNDAANTFTKPATMNGGENIDFKKEVREDIVITGYGTSKRSRSMYASSIVTIRNSELTSSPNLVTALQGKVAGLLITQNSGSVDNSLSITLRGSGSLNSRNQSPLCILDGIEISINEIQYINTHDVANVEILKEIHASAMYGSRGSNGVIIIKSKKPNTTINYEYKKGTKIKNLDDEDYYAEMKAASPNAIEAIYYKYATYYKHKPGFMLDAADLFLQKNNNENAILILQEYLKYFSANLLTEDLAINVLMLNKRYYIAQSLMSSYEDEMENNALLAAQYVTCIQKTSNTQAAIIFGNNIIKKLLENNLASDYDLISLIIQVKSMEQDIIAANKNLTRVRISASAYHNHLLTLNYKGQNENIINQYIKAEKQFKDSLNTYNSLRNYNYNPNLIANNYDYIIESAKGKIKLFGSSFNYNNYYNNGMPVIINIEITRQFGTPKATIESYTVPLDNIVGTELELFDTEIN